MYSMISFINTASICTLKVLFRFKQTLLSSIQHIFKQVLFSTGLEPIWTVEP